MEKPFIRLRAFAYKPNRIGLSSAPHFLKVRQRTYLETHSEAYLTCRNAQYKFSFLARYFTCTCLEMKVTSIVQRSGMKPNSISFLSNILPYKLFDNSLKSSESNLLVSFPYSFFSSKHFPLLIALDNSTKIPLCWNNNTFCYLVY